MLSTENDIQIAERELATTSGKAIWKTQGFEAFAAGTFGQAGQNIYVSRAGVLQRIHRCDITGSGHVDLLFCNSQDNAERPPGYMYHNFAEGPARRELPSDGAWSAAIADLNGDGYDDLVIANWYNGISLEVSSTIYYGSPDGWSERCVQHLPAPWCTSVAVGDFLGVGRPSIALQLSGKVRIFHQTELGFEPARFVELEVQGQQLGAADLDGDGCAELLVRDADGRIRIFWGSAGGLSADRVTTMPDTPYVADIPTAEADLRKYQEYVADAQPLVQAVVIGGEVYVFAAGDAEARLVPVRRDRSFGEPVVLRCQRPMSITMANLSGRQDLILACRDAADGGERSWVYWGGDAGFSDDRRTALPSQRACDVVAADLDGSGRQHVVLCQNGNDTTYSTHCLVYRHTGGSDFDAPIHLESHDARRVLVGRGGDDPLPQVVVVNRASRNSLGNIDATIYIGGPDGFRADRKRSLPAWGAVSGVCADFNDDGRPDLAIANAAENSVYLDPGSYVYLSHGHGLPDKPSLALPTVRAHGVACADLDRDGYLDLVFCGFDNNELLIFHGSADGFDSEHPTRVKLVHDGVNYKEPRWIYLADLNNDGYLDLVVPQIEFDRSFILWGGPRGFSMDNCRPLSVNRGACAQAVDLTGNGYLDLIIGGGQRSNTGPHDSFVYIYWNSREGLSESRRTILPVNHCNCIAVADFDNDGRLDLFVGSYADGRERDLDSYIYWNRKDRYFAAADRTRLPTHSASGCIAADFDGDGYVDLAIANHKVFGDHEGYSEVWWNGPDGFDKRRTTRLPTSGPHGMLTIGPGSMLDRGPEEFYVSAPAKLPANQVVHRIGWEATEPQHTWVSAQLRFAASPQALASAEWSGPCGKDSHYTNGQSVSAEHFAGCWVQYRLALCARDSIGTPRVTSVCLEYGPTSA